LLSNAVSARADSEISPPPAAVTNVHGSVFVDPLGFLLFGPRLGVEVGFDHLAFAATARWFNAGLLSRVLFLNQGDSFEFSYGVGGRGRYYFGDQLRHLHIGGAVEYLGTKVENSSELSVSNSGYVVPQLKGGYRFAFGHFCLNGSASVGYAFQVAGTVQNLPGGSSAELYQAENKSNVYGSAALELGVFF